MELTYQHLPQHEYLIDNCPARTYGEWPGIKSNHWKGSIHIIQPCQAQKIFDNTSYNPLNRRHYSERHGYELPFKPEKKIFADKKAMVNIEDKTSGLKKVNPNNTITKLQYDKKHFDPRYGINYDPEVLHIKTFHPDGNFRTFNEISIEKECGIKRRIYNLTQQRNGMDIRVPGDKNYKLTEQLPNFFKDGGLIPGSTNVTNFNKTQSKKANNFYETLDLSVKTLDEKKIWKNKVKKENLDNDAKYVKTLAVWENNILNDYLPPGTEGKKAADKKDPIKAKEVPGANTKRAAPAKGKK